MNNALLYFGGFLVAAFALLFAVPYVVDWNSYRGVFEEEASRVLGREVRVGGPVNLRLLPTPYVKFEKLRIADAAGDGGNSIFRAERFTMWLSVAPLLRGVVEAHRVEVKRPVIQLALDKDGAGNWRSLAVDPNVAGFLPKDVALNSVAIIEGIVAVSAAEQGELARFEGINGELTAEALEGPYKFRGTMRAGGKPREVRIATARQDTSGEVRLKAAVTATDTGNSYVVDARLRDLKERPRVEGELVAKLRISLEPLSAASGKAQPPPPEAVAVEVAPPAPTDGPPAPPPAPVAPAGDTAPRFDLRAKIAGDGRTLKLDDIAVVLDQGGPPQLINGSATLSWAERMRVEVALASRWLDLDRLTGASQDVAPLAATRAFFEALAAALPAEADTNATLVFDQLNLGREAISNVRLAASRSNGPLELKGVRATLPGSARLALDGVLTPGTSVPKLDGNLTLTGQSLTRFLAWGFGQSSLGEASRLDSPFALEGRFALGEQAVELTQGALELNGERIAGHMKLDLGERRKLAIAIEGSKVDAAQFKPGVLSRAFLEGMFLGEAGSQASGQTAAADDQSASPLAALDPAGADVSLKVRLGEIVDGARVLRDVEADIATDRGRLSIPTLRFTSPDGLRFETQGELTGLPEEPKGTLTWLAAAPSQAAGRTLVDILALTGEGATLAARLTALAPLRLAGTLDLRRRGATSADFAFDGLAAGGRIQGSAKSDGGRSAWRARGLDAMLTLDAADIHAAVAALGDTQIPASVGAAPTAGRIVAKGAGTPASGMRTFVAVAAPGLNTDFNGRVAMPPEGVWSADGSLKVMAEDARALLAAAGLKLAPGVGPLAVDGTLAMRRSGERTEVTASSLNLAGSSVSGTLAVLHEGAEPRIDADLKVDAAGIPALLSPLLAAAPVEAAPPAPPPPQVRGQPAPLPPDPPVWPEQAFDTATLAGTKGSVKLAVDALALEPGLTIANARIAAELDDKGIKLSRLDGDVLGGRLSSDLAIEKAAAGVGATGKVRIDLASNPPAAGADVPPGDIAAFAIDFTGRALSPAALIDSLTGKGSIVLGDATLTGRSPAAVATVAEQALTSKTLLTGEPLVEALRTALKQGEIKLGKITVPVEIKDGALKLDRVEVESDGGKASFQTSVELATMKIDSEWQIEPRIARPGAAGGERTLLPPVAVVYVGKLAQFASLEPRITTGALERELAVRKMERDVDELERLRRADEKSARQQAERRRLEQQKLEQERLDAERQRQGTTAPADPTAAVPPAETAPGQSPTEEAPATAANPDPGAGEASGPATAAAAPAPGETVETQEPAPQRPPPRRRRPAPAPWQPFQITPY